MFTKSTVLCYCFLKPFNIGYMFSNASYISCLTLAPESIFITKYELAHEKRDLMIFRFVVLQMCMPSSLFRLQTCIFLPEASSRSLLHV